MFASQLSDDAILRLLETRHADEFFQLIMRNRECLAEWCPWLDRVATVESTRQFLRDKIGRYADGNGFTAGIFSDGKLAGVIALEYIDHANFSTEIGYWLDADAEGRGLVTAACRGLIDHAFADLGLERIQIRCAVENTKSRAIPERLGFREEGVLRQCEKLADRKVDLVIYGLLVTEWSMTS